MIVSSSQDTLAKVGPDSFGSFFLGLLEFFRCRMNIPKAPFLKMLSRPILTS